MEWNEIRRVMVVFAHPDDAEFGSAGTAAKLAQSGIAVDYVVVTDGSKGSSDPDAITSSLIETREAEQRCAAAILGVDNVIFLGFPDGLVQATIELRKAITAAIRRYKPDVVIAHNPVRDLTASVFVQHPDHLATGEATFAAVYPCCRDRLAFPELLAEGLEPHVVREIWVASAPNADHFVDITDTLSLKLEALQAHSSQVGDWVREVMTDRARELGEKVGMKYAEAYKRIELPA